MNSNPVASRPNAQRRGLQRFRLVPGVEQFALALRLQRHVGDGYAVLRRGGRAGGLPRERVAYGFGQRAEGQPGGDGARAVHAEEVTVRLVGFGNPQREFAPRSDAHFGQKLLAHPREPRVAPARRATLFEEAPHRERVVRAVRVEDARAPGFGHPQKPPRQIARVYELNLPAGRRGRGDFPPPRDPRRPAREANRRGVRPDEQPPARREAPPPPPARPRAPGPNPQRPAALDRP